MTDGHHTDGQSELPLCPKILPFDKIFFTNIVTVVSKHTDLFGEKSDFQIVNLMGLL